MRLSKKALMEKPEGWVEPERRPRTNDRRPTNGRRDDNRGGYRRDDRRDDHRGSYRRDDRRDDRHSSDAPKAETNTPASEAPKTDSAAE